MKTVFTSKHDVAHLFATGEQDYARAGNLYFRGDTIYSYGSHFPIAKKVTNKAGQRALFYANWSYSNFTSKHMSAVYGACNHMNIIYCYCPTETPEFNFEKWLKQVEEQASKLPRARKPERYLNAISAIGDEANIYADFLSIKLPTALFNALKIGNTEEFAEYSAKKIAYLKAEQVKAEKKKAKLHAKDLKKWLNRETNYISNKGKYDYLRVGQNRIETSQRVQIAFYVGRAFFDRLRAGELVVGDKLDYYRVNHVGKTIRIGCHEFELKYLLKFGEEVYGADSQVA